MSKLDGIKAGDRVRVTFEGVYSDEYGLFGVTVLKRAGVNTFTGEEIESPTFHIERIAQPVKVGDMVTWGCGANTYEVVAERDGMAILWRSCNQVTAHHPLADLRHAE